MRVNVYLYIVHVGCDICIFRHDLLREDDKYWYVNNRNAHANQKKEKRIKKVSKLGMSIRHFTDRGQAVCYANELRTARISAAEKEIHRLRCTIVHPLISIVPPGDLDPIHTVPVSEA